MREMAELFLREATARPDCPEAVIAHRNFGTTCWYFGDFAGAHDHYQKSLKHYDQARHGDSANRFGLDSLAAAEAYDVLALWVLGRIDEALSLVDRALADAESAAHTPTMAHALEHAARLGLFRRSPEAVATYSQALADIVSRYDLPAFLAGRPTFFRAGRNRGAARTRRGWPRCRGASLCPRTNLLFCACPFPKRPWLKPKRVSARLTPASGAWTMCSPGWITTSPPRRPAP
jgi:tetratricopeptide (TPR) repeat protein